MILVVPAFTSNPETVIPELACPGLVALVDSWSEPG